MELPYRTVTSSLEVILGKIMLGNHQDINIAFKDSRTGLNQSTVGFVTCFLATDRV